MLPKTSFAMVQTGVRELRGQDIPLPQIDDNSAILQIEACGICGSDYEQYEGVLGTPMPVVPGHEPLGRTVPLEKMHTHDFKLEEAELAIRTLARQVSGDESIHSCLVPEF